ncbi:uncharacterized protein [Nothobranchius furzeri]|uniref:uncharacterized protein n=1 Tax=Nothobranchius furzeri TaxID=105023 RepID=UPI003904A0C6
MTNFSLVVMLVIITQGKALNVFQIHGQGVDEDPLNVLEVDKDSGKIYKLGPVDQEMLKKQEKQRHGWSLVLTFWTQMTTLQFLNIRSMRLAQKSQHYKQLDYEGDPVRNITVTVENEIPYFSCKVKKRSTVGLWEIETLKDATEEIQHPSSCQLTVYVEDVDEPPFFTPPEKDISVPEDVEVGQHLETFTAKDPDFTRVDRIR